MIIERELKKQKVNKQSRSGGERGGVWIEKRDGGGGG